MAELSAAQFGALAELLSIREPARTAAARVLVDGQRAVDAAAETGLTQPAVSRAVNRYRKAHQTLLTGYGNGALVGLEKNPTAFISLDGSTIFVPEREGQELKVQNFMAHWVAHWEPLYRRN